MSTECTRFIKS